MVLEKYQPAEMEIIEFEAEDIITTSGGETFSLYNDPSVETTSLGDDSLGETTTN